MRKVIIAGEEYESASAASRILSIPLPTLFSRLMSTTEAWVGWFYADGLPAPKVKPKKKLVLNISYIVTHVPTGKFYVGSTINFTTRKASHLYYLRRNRHDCGPFQELFNKDSDESNWKWDLFVWENREQAYDHEQSILDQYRESELLLNLSSNARSSITYLQQRDDYKEIVKRRYERKLTPEQVVDLRKRRSVAGKLRWSDQVRREARKGAGNPFAKKVKVDGVVYGSVKDAQAALGINEKTIRKRANSPEYPNYSFNVV